MTFYRLGIAALGMFMLVSGIPQVEASDFREQQKQQQKRALRVCLDTVFQLNDGSEKFSKQPIDLGFVLGEDKGQVVFNPVALSILLGDPEKQKKLLENVSKIQDSDWVVKYYGFQLSLVKVAFRSFQLGIDVVVSPDVRKRTVDILGKKGFNFNYVPNACTPCPINQLDLEDENDRKSAVQALLYGAEIHHSKKDGEQIRNDGRFGDLCKGAYQLFISDVEQFPFFRPIYPVLTKLKQHILSEDTQKIADEKTSNVQRRQDLEAILLQFKKLKD